MKKLIAFSGLDGAGKSTQIELLKSLLLENGFKSEAIWSRGGYTNGMEFFKRILRKSAKKTIPKPGRSIERDQKFQNKYIRKLWLTLATIDLFLLYAIIFRVKMASGKIIIADRYLEDTVLDFKLNFPDENISDWIIWKILKICAPHPNFYFISLIPVEESIERSVLKNEPFPDSEEILRLRKIHYELFAKENVNTFLINGMNSIVDIHSFVVKTIGL